MPFAAIMAGASIGSALIGANAAQSAADTQAAAAGRATDLQRQMFQTQQQQGAPYRQTGYTALGTLATGFGAGGAVGTGPLSEDQVQQIYQRYMGRPVLPDEMQSLLATNATAADLERSVATSPEAQQKQTQGTIAPIAQPLFIGGAQTGGVSPGQFTHQFTTADLKSNLAPNYEFQLQQGLGATQNFANASGGLVGGNTLKAINDYAQNYAQNAYQQAFQNYSANQTNIFNRLSSIAGLGQTANATSANLAGSIAPSLAGTIVGQGAASAAGTVGAANAISGGATGAAGWYSLPAIMAAGRAPAAPGAVEAGPG